jgi:hypothetical protein
MAQDVGDPQRNQEVVTAIADSSVNELLGGAELALDRLAVPTAHRGCGGHALRILEVRSKGLTEFAHPLTWIVQFAKLAFNEAPREIAVAQQRD